MIDQSTQTRQICYTVEHCHLWTATHHGWKTAQNLASKTIWAGIQDCASKFKKCHIQNRRKISLDHFQCIRWHVNKSLNDQKDFPYRDTASFGSPLVTISRFHLLTEGKDPFILLVQSRGKTYKLWSLIAPAKYHRTMAWEKIQEVEVTDREEFSRSQWQKHWGHCNDHKSKQIITADKLLW